MNLEDTLRKALQTDAAELVPVGPGPDDARRRAHRRRRRMQAGVVSLSAVALVGASLAIVDSRSSGQGPRVQSQPGTSQPAPDLAWRSVDGTVLYDSAHFTTADGVTYALSTAPGAPPANNSGTPQEVPQELYTTHNGIDWTHQSLGSAPWITDLTASKGVLYALGTGPGSQGGIDYNVATSSDGGANWDHTPIDVSFTPPSASVHLTPMTSVKLARGAHTTVVIASVNYRPDSSNVAGHQPTIATDHGIEVIDPSSCKDAREGASPCSPTVKETKPWSDLGITQPELLHQQKALVRDDDGSWVPVPIASQAGVWLQDVAATSHGFVIAESVPSADGNSEFEQLVSSPDGRTWTPLGSIPPIDSVSISGDRVIGTDSKSSTVYTSNDAGETWSEGTALSSLVAGTSSGQPFAMTIDVGPLGYAIVAQPAPGPAHSYLLYSVDGNAWKSTDLASVGAPADGSFASASVGSDHIDVTFQVPADRTGDVVTSWKLTTLVGTPKA